MRILAIDPGAKSGFCFGIDRDRPLESGCWSLGADAGARPGRLAEYIRLAVAKHRPQVIAYEVATMGGKHLTAMRRLNELCGAIQAAALTHGCEAWAWNIMTWKLRAVGKGNADKTAVIRLLRLLFGIEVGSTDEGDAVGLYLASQLGPPPPTKKQVAKQGRKAAKALPRLF